VLARAAPLDLDEVGGRKDRAHQAQVEDVGAVVAGGHHADGDADAGLAGLVGGQEVGRAEQVVVGEVDGELLRVGICEVTCTAKSDWYLPGNMRSASSLRICASLAAWFWLTAKTMDLPIRR
jgi:hypothetical protein